MAEESGQQQEEKKHRFKIVSKLFRASTTRGLPFVPSMTDVMEKEKIGQVKEIDNRRVLYITMIASIAAVLISIVGKALLLFIYFITNISFYGKFSFDYANAFHNHLGLWIIPIPIIGAIIVGYFAKYGNKAIRGHGIPEAMESILTNKSKMKPSLTFLKPIASAFAIGTGGPFGAEGPIISTGAAGGSVFGQILKVTSEERKILLAAGAAAGMAAIFGAPIASVLMAIELLLFEFSPKSIIPVSIASVIGAIGHYTLFGSSPIFEIIHGVHIPTDIAIVVYCLIGLLVGIASVIVTKFTYWMEDMYAKLPVHWMWWPAIGAVVIGVIGYIEPRTLGVGYENIRAILNTDHSITLHEIFPNTPALAHLFAGHPFLAFLLAMAVLKFLSWAISLSSGTAGGTLAPLFTIGGAIGALVGMFVQKYFPAIGISIGVAAVVGMASMFAGAARALFTSIVFAIETTLEPHIILPLLGACTIAYFISFIFMHSSIMTEKIVRRGVHLPTEYTPDVLDSTSIFQIMNKDVQLLSQKNSIGDILHWLKKYKHDSPDLSYCVVDKKGKIFGEVLIDDVYESDVKDRRKSIARIAIERPPKMSATMSVNAALRLLQRSQHNMIIVVDSDNERKIVGTVKINNIYKAYSLRDKDSKKQMEEDTNEETKIRYVERGELVG